MIAVRAGAALRLWLALSIAPAISCGCPGQARTTGDVVEIDASDAVLHGSVSRLRVRGRARIDAGIDHRVVLSTQSAETAAWFHLVPVVDESWDEGDPVPLWITSASTQADVASWKRALAAALSRGPIEVEVVAHAGLQARERPKGWHEALDALAAAGGPTSDPRAPIATWPPP